MISQNINSVISNSAIKGKVIRKVSFFTMITATRNNKRKLYKHLNNFVKDYINQDLTKDQMKPFVIITPIFSEIVGKTRIGFEFNYWFNTSTDHILVKKHINKFIWWLTGLFHRRHVAKTGAFKRE